MITAQPLFTLLSTAADTHAAATKTTSGARLAIIKMEAPGVAIFGIYDHKLVILTTIICCVL